MTKNKHPNPAVEYLMEGLTDIHEGAAKICGPLQMCAMSVIFTWMPDGKGTIANQLMTVHDEEDAVAMINIAIDTLIQYIPADQMPRAAALINEIYKTFGLTAKTLGLDVKATEIKQ